MPRYTDGNDSAGKQTKKSGFTIVESIIVIVVIAILATITIVAHRGIRENATRSQIQADLNQANQKVSLYVAQRAGRYPATLGEVGVSNGVAGNISYYVSTSQRAVTEGVAPGRNLMPWDEPNVSSKPIDASDANWNGATGNSKIRIGSYPSVRF